MRIVAGRYGGRKLNVPKGRDIRPTSDKVRGAVFNALQGMLDLDGASVLDAFCGSGALGLEALSRGADYCLFVDKAQGSMDLAKKNASLLGADESVRFQLSDAARVRFDSITRFDLLFFDPPYGEGLVQKAMHNCVSQEVIADGGICVVESEKSLALEIADDFSLLKDKIYGDTKVSYLIYK